MTADALGLPLEQAKALFAGRECRILSALPPRRLDKTGAVRVVRVQECGEAVVLTVSPFDDTVKEQNA